MRVQFNYGVNIDQASIDVMQLIQRAKRAFPNDPNISEPTVFKFDPTSLPIVAFGVTSKTRRLTRIGAGYPVHSPYRTWNSHVLDAV